MSCFHLQRFTNQIIINGTEETKTYYRRPLWKTRLKFYPADSIEKNARCSTAAKIKELIHGKQSSTNIVTNDVRTGSENIKPNLKKAQVSILESFIIRNISHKITKNLHSPTFIILEVTPHTCTPTLWRFVVDRQKVSPFEPPKKIIRWVVSSSRAKGLC